MKFTDGYWMVREGYTVTRPAEAYEVWPAATPCRYSLRPAGSGRAGTR